VDIHDPEDSSPKRSSLTIVLAEGNDDQRFLLAASLRASGHHVVETGHGNTLREYLLRAKGDRPGGLGSILVVADLQLRGPDALAVFRDLARDDCRPRFILLTPGLNPAVQSAARHLGALAVFTKPFDFDDLRVVIRYLEGGD